MPKITSIISFAVLTITAIASGAPPAASETGAATTVVLVHGATVPHGTRSFPSFRQKDST